MIGHPLKVRELLEEIARGEILLPEFQRAYDWSPKIRLPEGLQATPDWPGHRKTPAAPE